MGDIGLRHDEQARRILVQTMDDPRPQDAADPRQIPAMMKQPADQRSGGMANGGMDNEPCGLVQDEQVSILIEDVQIHGFRFDGTRSGLGQVHIDRFPLFQPMAGLDLVPVDQDMSFFQGLADLRTGQGVEPVRQKQIETPACIVAVHHKPKRSLQIVATAIHRRNSASISSPATPAFKQPPESATAHREYPAAHGP